MKKFDGIEEGVERYPIDEITLEAVNEHVQQVADFAAAANGDNYISSGVEDLGNNKRSSGYIVWNGEILFLKAGDFDSKISILEIKETRAYEAGNQKKFRVNRYAEFGEITGAKEVFSFLDLKPVYSKFAEQVFSNGVILPWNKSVSEIPRGFRPCDGQDGRPDLGGQFLVALDANNSDYDAVGKTGGEEKVTLKKEEMPSHTHDATTSLDGEHSHKFSGQNTIVAFYPYGSSNDGTGNDGGTGNDSNFSIDLDGEHGHDVTIESSGGDLPHENRPPYYVVNYIIYVGF